MLQWFDIDKDWGEVRKSIMFLPKKEDKVYISKRESSVLLCFDIPRVVATRDKTFEPNKCNSI